jgi:hypothetical protein
MKPFVLAVGVLAGAGIAAQSPPSIEQLLARMDAYLLEYESQLSSIVADEVFDQKVFYRRSTNTRRLESEVAFMRLPGEGGWLGFRDVKKVEHQPIKRTGNLALMQVLSSGAGDIEKAVIIAQASSAHHLGLPRTINVPTATLEIVHPSHRASFTYRLQGRERVRGASTDILAFEEFGRPTVAREPNGGNLVSTGRVWIDQVGTIWRVEWRYRPENQHLPDNIVPRLRVEFGRHKELGMMVPLEMFEGFSAAPWRGEGTATYKNFRRFGTSAKIHIPQA